jgi:hypothetical protein
MALKMSGLLFGPRIPPSSMARFAQLAQQGLRDSQRVEFSRSSTITQLFVTIS